LKPVLQESPALVRLDFSASRKRREYLVMTPVWPDRRYLFTDSSIVQYRNSFLIRNLLGTRLDEIGLCEDVIYIPTISDTRIFQGASAAMTAATPLPMAGLFQTIATLAIRFSPWTRQIRKSSATWE